jgi:signal recognition particle subunit SRP68
MIVVHLAHKQSMTSIPDEPQQPTRELLSIPIHSLILAAHNAHGLGHGDFAQYRIYCTHRLARLRCHKSVKKDLSYSATGYKASIDRPPVRGGRHAFHPKSIVEDTYTLLSHPNFTLVHLYAAERAWSFAMELKLVHDQRKAGNGQGTSLKQSASPASVRRHSKQRLKKACKHVTQLLRCAHEACDEKTRAECLAYAGWIWGNYYFEVGQWEVRFHYFQSLK